MRSDGRLRERERSCAEGDLIRRALTTWILLNYRRFDTNYRRKGRDDGVL